MMGTVRKSAVCILAAILLVPALAAAAQENFDIDLKELRHSEAYAEQKHTLQPSSPASFEINLKELRRIAPPLSAKRARHKRHAPVAAVPEAAESGRNSIHVVQPGENLFLILMKRYGLSNQTAEQLIPEIMRLNGITSPQGLKIGQRLHIPLPDRNEKKSIPPRAAEAKALQQTPAASPGTTPPAPPKPAVAPSAAASISITSAPPCSMAHDILEKMGLLTSSLTRIQGGETVSATYGGRSVTVACGLSKAEMYTYERLLAHNGAKLLAFGRNESDACVVEKLADHLGLEFRKRGTDSAALPLTYIFAPFGVWPQELRLTILPAPPLPAH